MRGMMTLSKYKAYFEVLEQKAAEKRHQPRWHPYRSGEWCDPPPAHRWPPDYPESFALYLIPDVTLTCGCWALNMDRPHSPTCTGRTVYIRGEGWYTEAEAAEVPRANQRVEAPL